MADFSPVELCNLDYRPERGAAIDPHLDDSWLWGERLVTFNLLSDTVLTFSTPNHTPSPQVTMETQNHTPNPTPSSHATVANHTSDPTPSSQVAVEISMPRRSLIVVSGTARGDWLHSIQRQHVTSRRVAITLRELSEEFLPGGPSHLPVGSSLLHTASLQWTTPTQ